MISKRYYKISDLKSALKISSTTIYFWEKEFGIQIKKSKFNRRLYTKKDVEKLLLIKHLLKVEKYTIEGAKLKISNMKNEPYNNWYDEQEKRRRIGRATSIGFVLGIFLTIVVLYLFDLLRF